MLHIAPEAAVGGPLALVRDGDQIELDIPARQLNLRVDADELRRRRANPPPRPERNLSAYGWLYTRHVTQANAGCDFDFAARRPGQADEPLIF